MWNKITKATDFNIESFPQSTLDQYCTVNANTLSRSVPFRLCFQALPIPRPTLLLTTEDPGQMESLLIGNFINLGTQIKYSIINISQDMTSILIIVFYLYFFVLYVKLSNQAHGSQPFKSTPMCER